MDLRDDKEALGELERQGLVPVSRAQGLQMQQEIGAANYVECSSLKQWNVGMVFEEAVRGALHPRAEIRRKCSML